MMVEKEPPVSFVYGCVNHDRDSHTEDFDALERQLHANRPVPTDPELDRARQRAVNAASTRPRSRGRVFSPARLAMVSLVSGALLVGGSSASLAVSGLSSNGSAGIAQYVQSPPPDTGAVAPSQDQGGGTTPSTDPGCSTDSARASQTNCPEDDTGTAPSLDDGDSEPTAEAGDVQETEQIANGGSDGRLPFTGLLALPLLLTGVGLLVAGFALRSRTSDPSAA
jgi:hypothetical protein